MALRWSVPCGAVLWGATRTCGSLLYIVLACDAVWGSVLYCTLSCRSLCCASLMCSFFSVCCACFVLRCSARCFLWLLCAVYVAQSCFRLLLSVVPPVWVPCGALVALPWWLLLCLAPDVPMWLL